MNHDLIIETALEWHQSGQGAALATVVQTWGSAPRQPGSQLAISGTGQMAGSVSGGCVEGAVVAEAMEALMDGRPRLLTYGVSDDDAFAVGLACGGTIRILLEPLGAAMPVAMAEQIVAARAARRPLAYQVQLEGFARRLLQPTDAPDIFRADRAQLADDGTFSVPFNPPLRLAVVGAVHIAQALVPMAQLLGYDTLVIDPREAFASAARFPGATLSHDWPDEGLAAFAPDARSAIVTLTHDMKLDDPALRMALESQAFYIGALGSTRTHAKRLDRLRAAGVTEEALTRIHAPIGLDIGARSPAEIALSVLAEMTARLRGR